MALCPCFNSPLTKSRRIHHAVKNQDIKVLIGVLAIALNTIWRVIEHQIHRAEQELSIRRLLLFHMLAEKHWGRPHKIHRFPHLLHRLNHLWAKLGRCPWVLHVNHLRCIVFFPPLPPQLLALLHPSFHQSSADAWTRHLSSAQTSLMVSTCSAFVLALPSPLSAPSPQNRKCLDERTRGRQE